MTRVARLAAAAVSAAVGVGVLSACTATSPNAAIVNGTAIKQSTVLREMHALSGNSEYVSAYDVQAGSADAYVFGSGTASTTYTQAFAGFVLESEIEATLVHQEVARRHIEPSPIDISNETNTVTQQFPAGMFLKFPAWYQEEYKVRTAEAAAMSKALGPVTTTPAAVKDFFTKHPEDFISTQCVSDILVPTRAEAAKIRADIVGGAVFGTEARSYSGDSTSKAKGGDLGCNAPAGDNTTLDVAERTMALNRLSEPVYVAPAPAGAAPVTPGWYLILVRSRTLQSLDTTNTGRITQYFQQVTPLQVFLDTAVPAATVSINPAYGSWDSILYRVAAPLAPGVSAGLPSPSSP